MTDNYSAGPSVTPHMPYFGHDERPLLPGEVTAASTEEGGNLFSLVLDRMSGRWRYAIPLGLGLAVVFATLGYRSSSIMYESTGVIRVAPRIQPIMSETPEMGPMLHYSQFVNTEARLLTSSRVIERAAQQLDLSALPWKNELEAQLAIRRGIDVHTEFNSELIHVSYQSESPEIAQAMVNAMLSAFNEIRGSAESDELGRTLQRLRNIRETLRTEVRQKKSQIQTLMASSDYAVSDFNALIEQRAMQIQELEAEIRQLETALASSQAQSDGNDSGRAPLAMEEDSTEAQRMAALGVTIRDLLERDRELANLAGEREAARLEFERARSRFRPGHHAHRQAESEFDLVDRLYRDRLRLVLDRVEQSPPVPGATDGAPSLQAQLDYLRREVAAQQEQTRTMSELQLAITEQRNELEEIEQELSEVNNRIRSLEIESDAIRGGRISIASYGEMPLQPSRDRRRSLAIVGAMGGLGMGLGVFFLLGTIDRRAYAIRQLRTGPASSRLLGVLPALPRDFSDLEAAGIAAHCVHQIRNHIEAVREPTPTGVLTVSSPFQGDGKTSLVMALGASYATSGYRTVLVDCDLIGQSLTHHLQMHGAPGLREALRDRTLNESISPLAAQNLNVLPVGIDRHFGPEHIRKNDLVRLFDELRREYDIVLVDTGPMFGSVESLPTASASDGVILTMWRGRRQARLEECITSLRNVGAHYLGLVLNHARAADCERYVSKSKISALIEQDEGVGTGRNGSHSPPKLRNALLHAMQTTSHDEP